MGDYRLVEMAKCEIIEHIGGGPAVPEPSTWGAMATGFTAMGLIGLRRRRKA